MKKLLFVGIGIALTLVVLGAASLVYAQSQTPPTTAPQTGDAYQNFQGFGMMRGHAAGMIGAWRQSAQQGFGRGMMRGAQGAQGPMHQYMVTALAGKLDLSVDELQAKIEAGERPYDIAKALGLSDEQIQSLLAEAHAEALQAAVAAGALTQEQADFMSQRMAQMHQNGFGGRGAGFGGCPMGSAQP